MKICLSPSQYFPPSEKGVCQLMGVLGNPGTIEIYTWDIIITFTLQLKSSVKIARAGNICIEPI